MRSVLFEAPLFAAPEQHAESERILRSLVANLVRADMLYLKANPRTPSIYAAGIRYKPDPVPGQELFAGVPGIIRRGGADCEDLAAWRTAELRVRGERARTRIAWRRRGDTWRYHVTVRRGDGSIEDPSKRLGMGT